MRLGVGLARSRTQTEPQGARRGSSAKGCDGGRGFPGSRRGAEVVAIGFPAFDAGGDFEVVAVGEGGAETVEFVFEAAQGAEDFVAVLFENGAPDLRVARGDAGGVAQAAAGVIAPGGIFFREETAETGGDHLREVADVGDNFVVLVGCHGDHLGAEGMPERDDGGGGGGRRVGERSDEAGALLEEAGGAVFPAGFFRSGHGVCADEVGAGGEGGVAEAGDLAFHTADIGDEGAGSEIGGDLAAEGDNLVDRGGDHDEVGPLHGGVGRVGDGVAPRLCAEGEPRLRAAGPENDPGGDTVDARSAGDRPAEETGGEDRELGKGRHGSKKRKNGRRCRARRRRRGARAVTAQRVGIALHFARADFSSGRMAYKPTWDERLEEVKPFVGPAIAAAVVLALAGWLGWFLLGPAKATKPLAAPPKEAAARLAAVQRVAEEVDLLEKTYQRALESGASAEAAGAMLNRVIEKQRELLRLQPAATTEQTEKLARLEGTRGSQRSRAALARSLALEKEAVAAEQAGQGAEAREKLREALRLQREANANATAEELKDVPRESRLAQEIDAGEAVPLHAAVGNYLTLARSAVAQERWDEALKAFGEARNAQAELNQRFAATRSADLPALDKIDREIETLRAAGLAAVAAAREREGDAAAKGGRTQEAAASYAAAAAALREVNAKFSRSRFASEARVEELEVRRQTVLSAALLARAAEIEREIAAALRRRQNGAAAEKLAVASKIFEKVGAEFPRSRSLDPALQRKLAYLALRAGELDGLQEQVFARLAPLPEAGGLLMFRTEVPQEIYQRVMNTNPSRQAGRGLPVDSVSWLEAQEFCERLTWLLGLRVRLPREAEFRSGWKADVEGAWSADNSGGRSRETGTSPPSDAGFFDLAGNLAEWLQPPSAAGETAPVAGGSYLDAAAALKTVKLASEEKRERARHIGFRVVVEPGPGAN